MTLEITVAENLTQRELDVLLYAIQGYTNREISKELYISPHTVKVHIASISEKLGVNRQSFAIGLVANKIISENEINRIYELAKNHLKQKQE